MSGSQSLSLHTIDWNGNGMVGKSGCQPVPGHSSLPCAVPSQWEAGRAPAASIPVTLPVPFLWHRVSGALRVKRVSQASLVWMGWMPRANWYSILFSYPLLCMPPFSVSALCMVPTCIHGIMSKLPAYSSTCLTGLKLLCCMHCIHNLVAHHLLSVLLTLLVTFLHPNNRLQTNLRYKRLNLFSISI